MQPNPNKVSFILWASEDSLYQQYNGCRRDIANKALSFAWDWATKQKRTDVVKDNEIILYKSCKKYIKEHFAPSPKVYGYLSYSLCFYFNVNSIFNWVVKTTVSNLLINHPSIKNRICVKA